MKTNLHTFNISEKLLLFVFMFFCLQVLPTKAQWVTIPDTNFVTFLQANYQSCMNGNLMDATCSQIVNEDSLILFGLGIRDLAGVEYFSDLISLNCSSNYLTSINFLPSNLHDLNCFGNSISSISSIPDSLISFNCGFNQLTNLPNLLSVLQKFNCSANDIASIPSLPNSLKLLDCSSNFLISNLPQLPSSLLYLDCSAIFINNLPQLPNSLEYLDCGMNYLISLPPLPGSLIYLYCDHNQLTQLPLLPSILKHLDCGDNSIVNLPQLPINIEVLYASSNQLTSLPLLPDTMLGFYVADNNIYCFSKIPQTNSGAIVNNPLFCVPNQTYYSLGLPLCLDNDPINNSDNCVSQFDIAGYAFNDLNANCNFDSYDNLANNIPVKLYDSLNNLVGQNYTLNGFYGFSINQTGVYKVKLEHQFLPFTIDCSQPDSQIVNLTSPSGPSLLVNFPVLCNQNSDCIIHSITPVGMVFPGQTHI